MRPFRREEGVAAPLDRADVDTDQIIPKQFLKRIERTGYGAALFHDLRYDSEGRERPDFILNRPPWREATILVTGANFGCGSSREHAVWALCDFGIRAVVAPSFADIFRTNAVGNGLLPVELDEARVQTLLDRTATPVGYRLVVDLERCTVEGEEGFEAPFTMDPFQRRCLLEGLDEIALTLNHEGRIRAHEARRMSEAVEG